MTEIKLRPAVAGDISEIVELLDIATYGFVTHVFTNLSEPGSDITLVLKNRLETPDSPLSIAKAEVAEWDGRVAGFIMCEMLDDPVNLLDADTPALLRPLFELESLVPATKLINFVATFPNVRGLGIGAALVENALRSTGRNGASLTIHDQNIGARKLYERKGFKEIDRRPIVKQGWDNQATEWVLMATG